MVGVFATPYRLLIADDDRGVREILREIFEPYFDLVEAETGAAAVGVIERVRIDNALLDMHMPERTGLETLRVLKQVHADAPGILVTAEATDGLRRDAASADAFEVLSKPVRKSQLVSTVDRALRSAYHEFRGLV